MRRTFTIRSRRGLGFIYVMLIMVVMTGFVTFGVDLGRVQVAKTQLRAAADASARAAASAVRDSISEAQARGVSFAAANKCLGDPVTIDPGLDMEFGYWSRRDNTFTVLSGADLARANAARVYAPRLSVRGNPVNLVFGSVVGQPTCDVGASATAATRGGRVTTGIVGIEWIKMNGTSFTDSYDSREGPYNPLDRGTNGDITSNGPITFVGTVDVYGGAHPGPAEEEVKASGNVTIHGEVEPLTEPLYFPPVDASPYRNPNNNNSVIPAQYMKAGSFKLGASEVYTLPSGVYYFRDFEVAGTATLNIGADVRIYVTGDVKLAGTMNTLANSAANFKIYVAGRGTVQLTGTSDIYADVYAPEAAVDIGGTHDFFGAVVGRTLTISGTSDVHYDEALARVRNTPVKVFLVK